MFCFSPPAVELPDNLPFPEGEEVEPEIEVETLPGLQLSHKHYQIINCLMRKKRDDFPIKQLTRETLLVRAMSHVKFHLSLSWTHGNDIRVSLCSNLPYFSDRRGWVCAVPLCHQRNKTFIVVLRC